MACGNYYHYYRKHRFYNKVTKKGDISAFLMASGYQFLAILLVVAICLGLTCGVQDATYTWQIMAYGGSTLGGIILVGFLVSPWASNDDATTTYHFRRRRLVSPLYANETSQRSHSLPLHTTSRSPVLELLKREIEEAHLAWCESGIS